MNRKRKAVPTTPLVDKGVLERVQGFKTDVKTLLKTPNGNPLAKKYNIHTTIEETGGKHGDVFFVGLKDHSSDQTFAVKRQVIEAPKQLTDRSYRELLIFQHLNQLGVDNKCFNFVEIIEWFKATPNILTPERHGTKQLMHYVLEYADGATLNDHKDHKLTLHQYKCILFQIFYGLYVAQKELEFVHNDLHLRNILLKSLPHDKKYMSISDDGNSWVLQGYIAKLTDFGLSRITTKAGSAIYNPKAITNSAFIVGADIDKLSESLGAIKVDIQDPVEKSNLNSLKRQMRKGASPKLLLAHEFFTALKTQPSDCTNANTIFVNSAGVTPLRDVTNTFITPNPRSRIRAKLVPEDEVKQKLTFATPPPITPTSVFSDDDMELSSHHRFPPTSNIPLRTPLNNHKGFSTIDIYTPTKLDATVILSPENDDKVIRSVSPIKFSAVIAEGESDGEEELTTRNTPLPLPLPLPIATTSTTSTTTLPTTPPTTPPSTPPKIKPELPLEKKRPTQPRRAQSKVFDDSGISRRVKKDDSMDELAENLANVSIDVESIRADNTDGKGELRRSARLKTSQSQQGLLRR